MGHYIPKNKIKLKNEMGNYIPKNKKIKLKNEMGHYIPKNKIKLKNEMGHYIPKNKKIKLRNKISTIDTLFLYLSTFRLIYLNVTLQHKYFLCLLRMTELILQR